MMELSLQEAFEYQMKNTRVKSRQGIPMNCIEEKGGLEYLSKMKGKGYRLRDVARELGCAMTTVQYYCKKKGTQWSML